jgi:cysteine desulfurase
MFNFLNKIFNQKNKRVFLDFASATPTRKEVFSVMSDYNKNYFYNPSALYLEARKSKDFLDTARKTCGDFLNATKDSIVFTGSGTESNNLFILGVFEKAKENGIKNPHIISSQMEHPAVLEVLKEIEKRGGEVTLLSPDEDGMFKTEDIVKEIKENTVLATLMYINNEIGTVNDIREIGLAIKDFKKEKQSAIQKEFNYPYFHTDACQTPLYYNLDVSTLCLDGLSLDGLKIGGPKGCGLLFVKKAVSIKPIIFGGGQENGLRSGTENTANALGLAKALELAKKERKENFTKVEKLRDYFLDEILKEFKEVEINGSLKYRSPNNINICMKVNGQYLDSEYLVVALDTYGVCSSYSSSCRTLKEDSSSYVIESLGQKDCSLSSLRFTLSPQTTKSDLDFALVALKKAVKQVVR